MEATASAREGDEPIRRVRAGQMTQNDRAHIGSQPGNVTCRLLPRLLRSVAARSDRRSPDLHYDPAITGLERPEHACRVERQRHVAVRIRFERLRKGDEAGVTNLVPVEVQSP